MKPKDSQTYCSTYTGDDSIPAFYTEKAIPHLKYVEHYAIRK